MTTPSVERLFLQLTMSSLADIAWPVMTVGGFFPWVGHQINRQSNPSFPLRFYCRDKTLGRPQVLRLVDTVEFYKAYAILKLVML